MNPRPTIGALTIQIVLIAFVYAWIICWRAGSCSQTPKPNDGCEYLNLAEIAHVNSNNYSKEEGWGGRQVDARGCSSAVARSR